MNRLTEVLRALDRRLDLPQPARSRVLLEVAADLEDLTRHHRERGLSPDEARERAIEQCDLSDAAISQLVAVHAGAYRRLLERLSAQARRRWERLLLALVLVFVGLGSGRLLLTERIIQDAGPGVWLVGALAAIALAIALPKLYAAWLRQDHDSRRLRRRLAALPALAAANLGIGVVGAWLGLYLEARRAALAGEESLQFLATWLLSSAALLVICLLTGILTLVAWHLLASKTAQIEEAEVEMLLHESP